jgi:transcriptional regulator with XRE-family HTH domain
VKAKPRRKNIVGRRVAEARKAFSPALTQDDLSGRVARGGIQLDRSAIAKIENGLRHVLDYELKALAQVLEVEVGWLLGNEKKRPHDRSRAAKPSE